MQLLRKPPNGHMVSLTLTVLSVILLLTALPYFLYIFLGKKRILPFLMAGKAGMLSSAIWQGRWGLCLWVAAPSRARHSQEGYRWEMRTPSHLPGACWTRQRYYCLKHFFFSFSDLLRLLILKQTKCITWWSTPQTPNLWCLGCSTMPAPAPVSKFL